MGEALSVGSILNGVLTNAAAGGDPVKGALMNASLLAGSQGGGQLATSQLANAGASIPPPTPVIPGLVGGPSQVFSNPAISQSSSIPGLVGSSPNVFSSPANPITQSMVNGMNFPLNPNIGQSVAQAAEPSYWEQFKLFNRENPGLTQMGFSTAKDVLTPEQIAQAPIVPVQARGQLRPYDPMASMDPYKQSVIGGQPISLI
jgi:hypothetical protein